MTRSHSKWQRLADNSDTDRVFLVTWDLGMVGLRAAVGDA